MTDIIDDIMIKRAALQKRINEDDVSPDERAKLEKELKRLPNPRRRGIYYIDINDDISLDSLLPQVNYDCYCVIKCKINDKKMFLISIPRRRGVADLRDHFPFITNEHKIFYGEKKLGRPLRQYRRQEIFNKLYDEIKKKYPHAALNDRLKKIKKMLQDSHEIDLSLATLRRHYYQGYKKLMKE